MLMLGVFKFLKAPTLSGCLNFAYTPLRNSNKLSYSELNKVSF